MIAAVALAWAPSVAHAGEGLDAGGTVGLSSAGYAVVGGAALGASGYGLGLLACGGSEEPCSSFLVYAAVGAGVGGAGGAVGGAALGARAAQRRATPVVLATTACLGLGGVASLTGVIARSEELAVAGVVTGVVAAPIVAGVAGLQATPMLTKDGARLRLAGTF